MADNFSALVVDDEKNVSDLLKLQLDEVGFSVDVANDGAAGINRIQSKRYDVILLDLKMPRINGLEVLKFSKDNQPDAQVLILTGYGDIKTAVDTIKMGAFDFITKPYNFDELLVSVKNALEMRRLIVDNKVMKMQLGEGKFELVGQREVRAGRPEPGAPEGRGSRAEGGSQRRVGADYRPQRIW
ncbi:MAG: response regulator [Bacteroidetes bacterium]|nr:response regulator [Bacteroidota bacterium]